MQVSPTHKVLTIIGIRPTGDLGGLTSYTSMRGKPVWYLKAPPKIPATRWQNHQRNLIRSIASTWTALSPEKRAAWMEAGLKARLSITGYNLFVWWNTKGDDATIRTVQHQSGINLID